MAVKVTLHHISNAGPKQEAIAARACVLAEDALNNPDFERRVTGSTFKETRFEDAHGTTRHIPVGDLTEMIRKGGERDTVDDAEVDLEIVLDDFPSGVLGSTSLGKLPVRTAYWFINECIKYDQPSELAGHFIHEWLHVCGFYHWPNNRARGDVPYIVGNIVRDLARGHEKSLDEMPDYLASGLCADTSGPSE